MVEYSFLNILLGFDVSRCTFPQKTKTFLRSNQVTSPSKSSLCMIEKSTYFYLIFYVILAVNLTLHLMHSLFELKTFSKCVHSLGQIFE